MNYIRDLSGKSFGVALIPAMVAHLHVSDLPKECFRARVVALFDSVSCTKGAVVWPDQRLLGLESMSHTEKNSRP
jgi:hypothetical protein